MKKKELTADNLRPLIGGVAEVQILGERSCGGIIGDIAIHNGNIVLTFARYVEKQGEKWVRSENQPMPFSLNATWVDENLVIRDNDTVVVIHQSLESITKKLF